MRWRADPSGVFTFMRRRDLCQSDRDFHRHRFRPKDAVGAASDTASERATRWGCSIDIGRRHKRKGVREARSSNRWEVCAMPRAVSNQLLRP